jgi:hypothetical protein
MGVTARRNTAWLVDRNPYTSHHRDMSEIYLFHFILVIASTAFNEAPFTKFYTNFFSYVNLKPQILQIFPQNFFDYCAINKIIFIILKENTFSG